MIRRPTTPRPAPVAPKRPATPAPRPLTTAQKKALLYKEDELSQGKGGALRAQAAKLLQAEPLEKLYVVRGGDSYSRIAERQATEYLAQRGLKPSDPQYSTTWHRLAYRLNQDLMASNGKRPLRPGDQLRLPDPGKYAALVPGAPAPVTPAPVDVTPAPPSPGVPVNVTPEPPPAEAGVPMEVGAAMVNQFAGDGDGRNANCGFASSVMCLKLLGVDSPALAGLSSDYERAMMLRKLGGGGTNDRAWGTVNQVVLGLRAAGAQANTIPNAWGSDKAKAVEVMKQAFLTGTPMAFVAAGNPALGWPKQVSYNGGHFVTVAGYDAASDTFTVLDPVAKAPFQVTPAQLAAYLKDTNAEQGELIQVTRPQ